LETEQNWINEHFDATKYGFKWDNGEFIKGDLILYAGISYDNDFNATLVITLTKVVTLTETINSSLDSNFIIRDIPEIVENHLKQINRKEKLVKLIDNENNNEN